MNPRPISCVTSRCPFLVKFSRICPFLLSRLFSKDFQSHHKLICPKYIRPWILFLMKGGECYRNGSSIFRISCSLLPSNQWSLFNLRMCNQEQRLGIKCCIMNFYNTESLLGGRWTKDKAAANMGSAKIITKTIASQLAYKLQDVRICLCLFAIWRSAPDSSSSELSIKASGHADLDEESRFPWDIETLTVIVSDRMFLQHSSWLMTTVCPDQDAKSTFYAETCVTMRIWDGDINAKAWEIDSFCS